MVIIIETKAIVSKNPETSCLKPGGSGPGEFAGLERSGNACNYSAEGLIGVLVSCRVFEFYRVEDVC